MWPQIVTQQTLLNLGREYEPPSCILKPVAFKLSPGVEESDYVVKSRGFGSPEWKWHDTKNLSHAEIQSHKTCTVRDKFVGLHFLYQRP